MTYPNPNPNLNYNYMMPNYGFNFNPYNNMYNYMHPSYFANAMQQNYNPQNLQNQNQAQIQKENQAQTQKESQKQTITTQPPIMQSQPVINMLTNSRIIPVSNKEEATAIPVDLVSGTPTFCYNKGKNEVYLKQFDVPTGTAIFKVYSEIVEQPEQNQNQNQTQSQSQVEQPKNYEKELNYISDGIDNLHRMLAQMQMQNQNNQYRQQQQQLRPIEIKEVNADTIEIEEEREKEREQEPIRPTTKGKNNKHA